MKRFFLFSMFFLLTFNRVNGKDIRKTNSDPEINKKLSSQSNACLQQLVHRESNLWLTISNWGLTGSQGGFIYETGANLPAPSAHFPGGSDLDYLYMGAIWVGGVVEGETLVSVGADGWFSVYDMVPDACPEGEIKRYKQLADQEYIAVYTDTVDYGLAPEPYENRPPKPLKIEIRQHSYSWITPPYDDFVILDYQIKNFGDKYISDAYIGFYMDTDIYHRFNYTGYFDDVTGFLRKPVFWGKEQKMLEVAWSADNNGDLDNGKITYKSPAGVFGFTLLDSSLSRYKVSYNWWVTDGSNPDLDFGPWQVSSMDKWRMMYDTYGFFDKNLGTPNGDRAKYFLMSNGEIDYNQFETCIEHSDSGWLPPPSHCSDVAEGYDIRFLYSFGPFDIPAGDSINFAVGIVMGDSLHRVDNPINPQNPQIYYSKLNFDDLIKNVINAQMTYESGYRLPPPGPPKQVTAYDFSDSTILLSWPPSTHLDLKGYNIYRSSVSGEFPLLPINPEPVQDTFFLNEGLIEGSTYYYSVSCVQGNGETGKRSDELEFLAGKPKKPSGLMVISEKDKNCLYWRPNLEEDVVGYKIYRKAEGGEFELLKNIGLTGTDTSYCDQNFENGVVYYYAVDAVDRKGLEGYLSDSVFTLIMSLSPGILLVDMSNPDGRILVQDDSINAFYDRALQGYPFVYSKHDLSNIQYVSLKELDPYSVCLIHSEGRFGPIRFSGSGFDSTLANLSRYLKAGGKLILAGRNLINLWYPYLFKEGDFVYDYLHLKSIVEPFWRCGLEEFIGIYSTVLPEFTDLEVDTARVNLSFPREGCDLQGRLPLIGYFVPLYPEEAIYTFNSVYDTSEFEGKAIGMRHIGEDYQIYYLHFPLYYIKEEQSIPLLHRILSEFGLSTTAIEDDLISLPSNYTLAQNYPNPFNPTTTIQFKIRRLEFGEPIPTALTIYNILGQKVRALLEKELLPGKYESVWDGRDDKGKEVSSGIYFYQLKTGDFISTKKMVLLK